jgi:predicted esterase
MNRMATAALGLVATINALVVGGAAAGVPADLIRNGSGEVGDRLPLEWKRGNPVDGVEYRWDRAAGAEGSSSLCLRKTIARFFPIAQWVQAIAHDPAQRRIRVEAMIRAQRAHKAVVDVQFEDAAGGWSHQWVAYVGAREAGDAPADHDWRRYEGVAAIPEGTVRVAVALQIYGPGTVWFDAVRAEYVDPATPPTDVHAADRLVVAPADAGDGATNEAWAARLAALAGDDWRSAFAAGTELAQIPAERGAALLETNWAHMGSVDARQQILKAFAFARHPRLLPVLHLGVTDPSIQVQQWAHEFLTGVSGRDFSLDRGAYEAWYERMRDRALEEVEHESYLALGRAVVTQDGAARREAAAILVRAAPHARRSAAAQRALRDAGLLEAAATWLRSGRADDALLDVAARIIPLLAPDEAYVRENIVPALRADAPLAVRAAAAQALAGGGGVGSLAAILAALRACVGDEEALRSMSFPLARAIAEIGDGRAIEPLIEIIEADGTYWTVYGVGWFGLAPLTGVPYDESHDGAWWRRWWEETGATIAGAGAADPAAAPPTPPAAEEIRLDGDVQRRYVLIGPKADAPEPADGWRLLVVLPGGDGSADFRPFVTRMLTSALPDEYLVAQVIAPRWRDDEDRVVWPTALLPDPAAAFTTESFVAAVVRDVSARRRIDARRVFALGWSSGGPPCYASSLAEDSPVRGAFVAMSVFKPELLPPLERAKGRAYYILHSPQDFIAMRFPEAARDALRAAGAKVELATYAGGHGWHGDVSGMIRTGVRWLEEATR